MIRDGGDPLKSPFGWAEPPHHPGQRGPFLARHERGRFSEGGEPCKNATAAGQYDRERQ